MLSHRRDERNNITLFNPGVSEEKVSTSTDGGPEAVEKLKGNDFLQVL